MITCPICDEENEDGLAQCKNMACRYDLQFSTMKNYYAKVETFHGTVNPVPYPKIDGRKEPFKVVQLKRMDAISQNVALHAEGRLRIQFRILHIYAWMLERGIIAPLDQIVWNSAPLQQGKATGHKIYNERGQVIGSTREAAHQLIASLIVSSDEGKTWHYLYELPKLATCAPAVAKRVKLVLGALHATVTDLETRYNDTDAVVEEAGRGMVLAYIDSIRGIHIAKEYTTKTWPRLWYAFRDDYVALLASLRDKKVRALFEKARKLDERVLEEYIHVAKDLKYEPLKQVKDRFKSIVNKSEGNGTWT
ncbi:hypothetical protein [Hyalangium gracile]|uniref:hypothetical protein n=1 Tax=Hyalangium gracile TaxID=394092 RepID=UPI001CCBAF71|nr:hypothetical protein [Hyalangium gracile]